MDKPNQSVEAEINALVTDLDDDDEVVFLQEWDQPTRRHKVSGSWRKDQTRRNWMVAGGVGIMMIVCTVGLMAVAADTKGSIPEQLRGVWRTSTSRYADAALGLQAREIAFYNGRGIPDKYHIDDVRLAQVDDMIRYSVDYSGEEQAYTIQFLASRDVNPTIQLVSRPEMNWSRGNVRFGPEDKSRRNTVARADTARALTPLSAEFVACIKAASRARAAGQEPVRCTQPTPEVGMGPTLAAEVERDTTISLMEDLGAQRRNR